MGGHQEKGTSVKTKKVLSGGNGSAVRAVFFDAGNTLLRVHPSVGHVYALTARRHGVVVSPETVDRRFQRVWKHRHGIESLTSDRAERDWWRTMVARVMGPHFTPRRFSRYFDDLYGRFAHPRHWRLFDDALPTLRALRSRGVRLGIVSNWDSRLVTLARRLGLDREVEFLLVSSIEGLVKPDRRLFRRALRKARVDAHEAVHVGDSLAEDYHGALRAGLTPLLLDRRPSSVRGVRVIRSLTEVLAWVDRSR